MFRKILIITMFATAAGYCFASENEVPQVATSQVFYDSGSFDSEDAARVSQDGMEQNSITQVPVWPAPGSDADVKISEGNNFKANSDNIKIVSKIGADLVVENNINVGAKRGASESWSGGANMLHSAQLPAGFYDDCNSNAEMPLLNREMLEDDGGNVLAVSRSANKKCGNINSVSGSVVEQTTDVSAEKTEIQVDESFDAEDSTELKDQARSWVVASGQTLRQVLQTWCDKEGWDLVWTTSREYPIEASAIFKGRFVDVSSALVRNFGRATPTPYAKFYKGNRVIVISTIEE